MQRRYNPKEIEPKWQEIWDSSGTYTADLKSNKPKYIAMSMFNYPSGAGIHIGHAMNYTISDVKARFKRQQGYESYHPVGWDSFGLPAENYAIKAGVSPQQSMAKIIPDYHKQYKAMGWSNDWEKEIATHLPEYYKWTQWIFAQMYKHGLAYQDSRMQWWCDIDNTVLANEQVIDGKCWRHDGPDDPLVSKKEIKQWFFKISDYADELLEAIDDLDWTESVKLAQKNWIGKSKGAEIDFKVDNDENYVLLHGYTATSNSDFHPNLVKKINDLGKKVQSPDLPNTDNPIAMEQVDYVLNNCSFDRNSVVLGHSLGSVIAMKTVEKLDHPIKRLVLVAGFAQPNFKDHERPFEKTFDWQFDFEKIKNNAQEIIIMRDLSDTVVPKERADYLAEKLGGRIVDFTAEEPHATGKNEPVVRDKVIENVKVFTTRPDTIFGATFLVLAPEHELVDQITKDDHKAEVQAYKNEAEKKSELERQSQKEKTGVFTGAYAINPVDGNKIPIWIADYVLVGYGTGAIMAVPAHDERDNEFAKKFNLPIIRVVKNDASDEECSHDEGIMINSGDFNDQPSTDARENLVKFLEDKGEATEKVNYRMNDWSVSRQRYWGAPIPIVHCPNCGPILVPDDQLPVIIPELDDFAPSGDGRGALARATDWLIADCPNCGEKGERETDTLDTYICSSWYMFRYFDPHNQEEIFDKDIVNKWAPVDFYNGGDHATAHLLYARFIGHFFHNIGLVDNPEPFKQMLFNGKVTAKDGTMFSKSKGNGVDPLDIIGQGYGADALRTYLMFAAPLELWIRWDPQGVPGAYRFLSRLWTLVQEYLDSEEKESTDKQTKSLRFITNKAIKKVTHDLENNFYNTAIAASMSAVNDLYKEKIKSLSKSSVWKESLESIVALVAPFAPHTSEELWHQLGHSTTIHKDSWPKFDETYLKTDTVKIIIQVNGKLRGEIEVEAEADKDEIIELAKNSPRAQDYLKDQEIKKSIYVPGKLVNFVI